MFNFIIGVILLFIGFVVIDKIFYANIHKN